MFQLGSLVVLCGLLTGTSASLPEFIKKLDMQITRERELQDMSMEREIKFIAQLMNFKRFKPKLYTNKSRAEEFQDKALELEFQLDDLLILDFQDDLSSKDKGREIKISIALDVYVILPKDNPRDNTTIALEHEGSLRVKRESQNSLPYVTMNETMKDISDSSGRQNATMDSVMDRVFNSLSETVSLLMKKQILEMSDAPLKLLAQAFIPDLLMEENQLPSEEEGADGGMS